MLLVINHADIQSRHMSIPSYYNVLVLFSLHVMMSVIFMLLKRNGRDDDVNYYETTNEWWQNVWGTIFYWIVIFGILENERFLVKITTLFNLNETENEPISCIFDSALITRKK